jgi:alpha/beta superfamily hydrolase
MPFAYRSRFLALGSLLALGLVAASAPSEAPAPPNGAYVYALTRNGSDQGKTTVVLFRRPGEQLLETDEAGAAGAARVHIVAGFRAGDLGPDSYVATYQAPFLHTSPFGRVARFRPKAGFFDQTTARYHIDGKRALDTLDGIAGERAFNVPGDVKAWVFDAPFMTGALLLPAFRHHAKDAPVEAIQDAFGDGADLPAAKIERAAGHFPKTPRTDLVLDLDGVAHLWFDPHTLVVHEAHFDALNLDAHLISYTRAAEPAPFLPEPTPSPSPALPATAVNFASADGTQLDGELNYPANVKHAAPVVVFVPPGPSAGRNFGGDGPNPMWPDLAAIFVQRGYAVLRYDTRGVGKSGGSSADETWDQAREDALAALNYATGGDGGTDPKRAYLLGYGNGADLALAASLLADPAPAGVIALAPTLTSYHDCEPSPAPSAEPLFIDGKPVDPNVRAWQKSANGHDPATLAARSRVPLFVLHPGLPICKETSDQRDAYDDKLRSANPLATIVVANDLTERFGGRYDGDSPANTEALFPYRFDASTGGAIADWLDNPKTPGNASRLPAAGSGPHALPPPPPAPERDRSTNGEFPNPHASPPRPRPTQSVEPGVVLPSGSTPPP